jgi:phenylalanyl-tRNA synthetase beta chain
MRVSLNWLQELVDINMSPEKLGRILTIAGFELEELIDLRANADSVIGKSRRILNILNNAISNIFR